MSHDVVIVGAGAAGCALAHRLSADPGLQVLLLEAGPDERPGLVSEPSRWPEGAASVYDPGHTTTEQQAAGRRRIALPRGRLLGGSTCINAMIHAVPRPGDLAGWGAGWADQDLQPSLRQSEDHRGVGGSRGRGGPMVNGPVVQPHPLCADFVTAAVPSGHASDGDPADGAGWFDLSIDGGERLDCAEAYLRPVLHRPNLTVRTSTTVTAIELADDRAVGARLSCGGAAEDLTISGELVLCAGAIESPALLLRSGIGPRQELARAGVVCHVDLPGVGANLHDHPLVPVIWASAHPVPAAANQLAECYLTTRSGPSGHRRALSLAFAHVAVPHPATTPTEHGATALVGLYQPTSRGRLQLDPSDSAGSVLIDPGYLSDPADVEALVDGVVIAREVGGQPALRRHGLTELLPGPGPVDRDTLRTFVRDSVGSYGHLAGTCAIGAAGVVGADLRVHGTRNVRVADASVVPTLPTVAPSATVQAIGWRAAELLAHA